MFVELPEALLDVLTCAQIRDKSLALPYLFRHCTLSSLSHRSLDTYAPRLYPKGRLINNFKLNSVLKERLSAMQLIVRSLGRTVALTASPTDSLTSIRRHLLSVCSEHAIDGQRFVFAGRTLDETKTLEDCSIRDASVLDLVPRLLGGVMEPTLVNLAREYNQNMLVCRHCYARNPLRATHCRRCRGTNLRKKKLSKYA